eukprot:223372-Prymnesium_polylepis.1
MAARHAPRLGGVGRVVLELAKDRHERLHRPRRHAERRFGRGRRRLCDPLIAGGRRRGDRRGKQLVVLLTALGGGEAVLLEEAARRVLLAVADGHLSSVRSGAVGSPRRTPHARAGAPRRPFHTLASGLGRAAGTRLAPRRICTPPRAPPPPRIHAPRRRR